MNIPRIRVLRRGYIDVTTIVENMAAKYVVACACIIPLIITGLAGWKIYELIKPLLEKL